MGTAETQLIKYFQGPNRRDFFACLAGAHVDRLTAMSKLYGGDVDVTIHGNDFCPV
jgi:hypothetical protein